MVAWSARTRRGARIAGVAGAAIADVLRNGTHRQKLGVLATAPLLVPAALVAASRAVPRTAAAVATAGVSGAPLPAGALLRIERPTVRVDRIVATATPLVEVVLDGPDGTVSLLGADGVASVPTSGPVTVSCSAEMVDLLLAWKTGRSPLRLTVEGPADASAPLQLRLEGPGGVAIVSTSAAVL